MPDQQLLQTLLAYAQSPFWRSPAFWISTVLGAAGLIFSFLAFREAKGAKKAATAAGRTVKIQTVTIELTEVALKLERIQPEIRFNAARDLLAEISRRLRRCVSPFAKEAALSEATTALLEALHAAKQSLQSVRPTDPAKEAEAPQTVYLAIEGDFTSIGDCLADLLGLFEKETLDLGDDDGES
jgi:hypothetical protein